MSLKFKWEQEFKETEVGEIPKEWEVKNLKWVVRSLESGNRPKGGALKHNPEGILSIGGENVTWQGDLALDGCLRFERHFYENLNKGKIEKDDILLVKDGATIGKLAFIKDVPEDKAMVNEHIFLIKTDKEKCDPRFLFYYLFSGAGQTLIESAIGGSAQGGINKNILEVVKITKCDLSEQSRIATVLSWFDDLIENKKKQNEILEKTAMAIFKSWFVDFEPFEEEGLAYNEELGKEIPKGWEVKRLKETAEIMRGISFEQHESSFEYFPKSLPILRASNIKNGKNMDFSDLMFIPISKVATHKKLKEKDIVMVGSNGNPALVGNFSVYVSNIYFPNFSFGAFMYCIRLKNDFLYIWGALNSDYFKEFLSMTVTGTNISNLKKSDLEEFKFPIPPPPILQKFHSLVEPLFQKIILNQKEIMVLRKVRDTLLPKLVFGKLRVVEI